MAYVYRREKNDIVDIDSVKWCANDKAFFEYSNHSIEFSMGEGRYTGYNRVSRHSETYTDKAYSGQWPNRQRRGHKLLAC